LGLDLATGIHTGEVEIRNDEVTGLALHVAERISTRAAKDEILVSSLVVDLVAGSGLHFVERAGETIAGFDTPLRLFAATSEAHLEPIATTPKEPHLASLSAREREVLVLVAEGLSNPAIAQRLRLSDHTVKRHVANILMKLDLPTRAAAAALLGPHRPV
jgi:DNA-binding NarL/FixJ family response regulator